MSHITVINDPANISDRERHQAKGRNLADWLIENYPTGFDVPTQIYAGGISQAQLIYDSESAGELTALQFAKIDTAYDCEVFICHSPLGFDPFTLAIFAVAAIVGALAVAALVKLPTLEDGGKQTNSSPNNSVFGQTNVVRKGDRVPDIFGRVNSYPDLISQAVFEFIDHVKYLTQYLCISRGYGLSEEIKSGDTLITSIPGSSAQIYDPGQTPSQVLKERDANEVSGQTLNPPNDAGLSLKPFHYVGYESGPTLGLIYGSSDFTGGFTAGSTLILDQVYFQGGVIENLDGEYIVDSLFNASRSVSGTAQYDTPNTEGRVVANTGDFSLFSAGEVVILKFQISLLTSLDGVYIISSIETTNSTNDTLVLDSPVSVNSAWSSVGTPATGSGDAEVNGIKLANAPTVNSSWAGIGVPQLILSSISGGQEVNPRASTPDQLKSTGPFVVPSVGYDQVWLDFQFQRGLVRDGNKSVTVVVNAIFEEIDQLDQPTGVTFTVQYSFTDNVADQRFYTRKVSIADGIVQGNRYRVACERISDTNVNDATLLDQCKWTRLASIEDITEPDQTGTTRMIIQTQATEQVASLQESKFNLQFTRKTVTWDGSQVVGDIETGSGLVVSKRMADAFLHYSLDPKLGARDVSQVDVVSLYAIQNSLDPVFNGEKGEFSFTFDNKSNPAINEMRSIANSCRCFIFREGGVISITRDEPQAISETLFNRRNKAPSSESKSINLNKRLDVNGVELEFNDAESDDSYTITLPDDLPVNDPNYGLPETSNPLKIDSIGIRNYSQAWDRAQYEFNRIVYKRLSVETTVTSEALLIPLNARVDHVDGTTLSEKQSDGEIKSYSGLTVSTSERCVFESGKSYSVILRDEVGAASNPIPVAAISGNEFGFTLQYQPPFNLFVRGDNGYQRGCLYNFGEDGSEGRRAYLIQRKSPEDNGNVKLELINYADEYYQADNQTPPVRN